MKFVGINCIANPTDDIVRSIEVWYDHISAAWVIQSNNAKQYQIGEVEYTYFKKDAVDRAKQLTNDKVRLTVFKRDGEPMA